MDDESLAQSALSFVDPSDRDTWVRMGIAVKGRFGDGGKWLWMDWSEGASSFNKRAAESVWKSLKVSGGLGLLIAEARKNGWSGKVMDGLSPDELAARRAESERRAAEAERQRQADYEKVRRNSQKFLVQCKNKRHPYLATKGFPTIFVPVRGDTLVLPMRDFKTDEVWNIQKIDAKGGKFYQKDGRAKGLVLRMKLGSGPRVYVEGFATGLSVRRAMQVMGEQGHVIVTFSAGNLAYVAKEEAEPLGCVVADNDEKGAGQKAAEATGLPWWMPPTVGADANDFHKSEGICALQDHLAALFSRLRSPA